MKKYKSKSTGMIIQHTSIGEYLIIDFGKIDNVNKSITINFDFSNDDWYLIEE